uniref:DNA-directed RNA polymerase RBP11-like dimerisation domain-containing protein n=1 Tax=Tetradesmus obliquus TaxID=3088 RepID=A0A383W506_TETOB|eukprot:jgi/Sobl393_1/1496/SZX72222.1
MAVPEEQRYSGTTFAVQEEDHTLANTLRFFLNKNPQVTFCGYSIPHPTEDAVNIRVQTTGEVTASQALVGACEECAKVCRHTRAVFDNALDRFKQQNPTQGQ